MLRFSLLLLALAMATALVGAFGVAGNSWAAVKPPLYVLLLLPVAALGFVSLRKSFPLRSQSPVRGFMFVVLGYFILALVLV